MNVKKVAGKILNIISALLIIALIYSFFSHGDNLKLLGIKIRLSYANIIRVIAVVLLIRQLISGNGLWLYNVIRKACKPFVAGINGKYVNIYTGGLLFLICGIILGAYDALYDPQIFQMIHFIPITPGWDITITRMLFLFLCYSISFFIVGAVLSWLLAFAIKNGKEINIVFYLAFLTFAFVSVLPKFSLISLEPYGPFSFAGIVIYIIFSFAMMLFLPKFILSHNNLKVILAVLAIVLIPCAYIAASYAGRIHLEEEAKKPHKRIILITMDTTRGDHLSIPGYNYNKETTPELKKIASEGIVFTKTYTDMPTTDPAHTSIMTGAYPRTHGLLKNGMDVSNPSLSYLQDWFRKNGVATAAITSRVLLYPEALGWPAFDYENYPFNSMKAKTRMKHEEFNAQNAYNRAKVWIDRNYDKDFFMWVHFWDPHWPYVPPKKYNSKFNSGFKGYIKKNKDHGFINDKKKFSIERTDYMSSLYDGEINYTDLYVSRLVRYIENKIPPESGAPLIIITADHGEALNELLDKFNYVYDHGETLNSGNMYIPLIIKWDGMLKGGRVVDELVESVDIAPTIIDLFDGRGEFKCDGKSFAPLLRGEQYSPKEALFGQRRDFDEKQKVQFLKVPEYSVTTKDWRLLINEIRGIELFDAKNDRYEVNNIADKHSDVVANLTGKLEEWKNKYKPAQVKPGKKVSDEKAKVLKSLGYVQ